MSKNRSWGGDSRIVCKFVEWGHHNVSVLHDPKAVQSFFNAHPLLKTPEHEERLHKWLGNWSRCSSHDA